MTRAKVTRLGEENILDVYVARATICDKCGHPLEFIRGGRCKMCNRLRNREEYKAKREYYRAKNKAWDEANKERISRYKKKWYEENRQAEVQRQRRLREARRLEA